MFKQGYISSDIIISKIGRDLKLGNSEWLGDVKEWIGEAIQDIGVAASRKPVIRKLKIVDYKVALPCKVDNFLCVLYNGQRLTLNPAITQKYDITRLTNTFLTCPNHYYNWEANYFTFTFTDREVEIVWMGIPEDDCGNYLIPDNVAFRESVMFYVLSRMIMGGYPHPIFTYEQCNQKYEHYGQRARNEVDSMKLVDMETFISEWNNPLCGADFMNLVHSNYQHNVTARGSSDLSNPFAINNIF
jgi:hypothetical protein